MDCAECALKLEKGVSQLPGVAACSVSFATSQLSLTFDPQVLNTAKVEERVRAIGYRVDKPPELRQGEQPADSTGVASWVRRHSHETLLALAGLCTAAGFGAQLLNPTGRTATACFLAAILLGGYHVARRAAASLRFNRQMDINVLMTLAVIGAALIGQWAEAATVVLLFSIGELLEATTMDRARRSIRSLMALAPSHAVVLRPCLDCAGHLGQPLADGGLYEGGPCPWCEPHELAMPVEEVAVGETVLVRPGERIAVDGVVLSGHSAVNQAPITGESMPVDKDAGDELFAGSVNGGGVLTVQVTRLAADNTINRLIRMIQEAQEQRAPVQRWVDRFARVYTPAVVAAAAILAVVPPLLLGQPFLNTPTDVGWLYRSLTLLVIACPCALVLSTPVAIVSAITAAARHGVLVKGGAYLEALAGVRVIAFDKTGTLTVGQPALTAVQCRTHRAELAACSECNEVLALAAAVERRSEHPLALAVVRGAEDRRLLPAYAAAEAVQALAGRGVRGVVNGQGIGVSSHRYVHDLALCGSEDFCRQVQAVEAAGQTTMLVHDDQEVRGYLAVADQVRPDSAAAIAGLRQAGIQHIVMLTGDNAKAADAIAHRLGLDDVRAELLPQDKVAAVRDLAERHGAVAMVGDGVNDAPAMAAATVGIAMGGAGVDQALETADVVLMGDHLPLLPFVVRLSRSTRAIIVQNIAFSLLVKAVFMALALAGVATLWMAVFADVGASLIVVFNSMRLLRARPRQSTLSLAHLR